MKYNEKKEKTKAYKSDYVQGIESIIETRQKNAEAIRNEYAKNIFINQEKYRDDLKKMLGWPLVDFHIDKTELLFAEGGYKIYRMQIEVLEGLNMKEHPEVAAGVNFNYCLNPLVMEMRSRINQSEIGDVRIISGYFLQDWLLYDTDYSWRLEPELSGPSCCVDDIGSHWMDTVQFVTGHRITEVMADVETVIPVRKKPPEAGNTFTSEVSAEYEEVEVKNEDYGAVLFKTDKGARGVFYVSKLCPGHGCDLNFKIDGSKASFRWDQEECEKLWMGHRDRANYMINHKANDMTSEARGHPEGRKDAFKGNIQSFCRYVQDGMTVAKHLLL